MVCSSSHFRLTAIADPLVLYRWSLTDLLGIYPVSI